VQVLMKRELPWRLSATTQGDLDSISAGYASFLALAAKLIYEKLLKVVSRIKDRNRRLAGGRGQSELAGFFGHVRQEIMAVASTIVGVLCHRCGYRRLQCG
jgi:hypothetical protein